MLPTFSPTTAGRERRQWTPQEDELLRIAVNREEPGNPAPSKWHAIAQHVPNRTNKDCRKRWYAKSADVIKGGWAPDEDQRLLNAIECYGTRWSLVASMVQTRNSDQCAKRWGDTLNPAIDRTAWSASQDDLLVQAVNEHGKVWTKIVQMYFPGRTGLAAKNRYNSITRVEGSSRDASSRRKQSPPSASPSPTMELEALDRAYSGGSRPYSTPPYSMSASQQPGYPGMYGGTGYPSLSPPSVSGYYSPTVHGNHVHGHARYLSSSSSQYGTDSPSAVPGYPLQYPQQQQQQYPNAAAFTTGTPYATSGSTPAGYSGSRHKSSGSSSSTWAPY